MNDLRQLLPENHIKVVDSIDNWKEAVSLASKPLQKEELITPTYVKNMIESVKNNGPYMVLADYFALMHAQAGQGVEKQSMSLLVTKKPIDLEGKPVKIFLILAAEDSQSHLKSLQEIMEVFMDEQKYQIILSGDKAEIVNLFK
ncbi:MAG: PTS sugar transporter subunit IIA [Tetragenococcus koreensis]|uniref:Ascorbate-specific PTS system EIIA component n=1 Tax=Tetragenococcus halophilus TaxID=51669 RepID=A0AB35HLJ0_TETHA|nr:PTS sugar transporter subunit IIA [Tetragenococcus halophilus]MDN6571893.1 PTS sugar transporter subunit IIA [Staphylococcus equorum]MDN6730701.1 PTS sugar transporter subunit IIA [Atopostipes suicloacalis]MDN6733153.1 PTS sugar transporter subunit IIA [Tetragenococcus koreensis]MCF1684651.1 PTS sugar transporter subunit IIA [Tetragenococcus halophilus]MCO8297088.1 PTS sugar transporter subunit IIA [Tetragenococcus halophilus]